MTKLVIFDLDETLLRLPVDWETVKKEIIGFGKKEGLRFDERLHIIPLSAAISNTEKRKKIVDSIWRRHELETLEKKGLERYPKAKGFVKKLRDKGIKLSIASNNCRGTIEKALGFAGLRNYFDLILGRDDILNTKPAPDMLLKTAWKFKLAKKEILFIGDSENDRKAGEAAKIRTVIVKPGAVFPEIKL